MEINITDVGFFILIIAILGFIYFTNAANEEHLKDFEWILSQVNANTTSIELIEMINDRCHNASWHVGETSCKSYLYNRIGVHNVDW